MDILNQVLSVNEAAALTGLSGRQVRRLCLSGEIIGRYTGGTWIILKSSIESYIKGRWPK